MTFELAKTDKLAGCAAEARKTGITVRQPCINTSFVEFGAGAVLTGLTKRILPAPRTANVSDPATLEEALSVLR